MEDCLKELGVIEHVLQVLSPDVASELLLEWNDIAHEYLESSGNSARSGELRDMAASGMAREVTGSSHEHIRNFG